jgi:carbonic anhydrase
MSCNAPINIKNTADGVCDLKCDYSYDYKDSTTVLLNSGNHIQLTYDMSPSAPVLYNTDEYQVREVRLYFPSIHNYQYSSAQGEILIIHGSGGKNLIVSVPIIVDNTQSKTSKFLDQVADNISKFAPNAGETVSLGNTVWNLNDWIPQKKYYSYSGTTPYSPCISGYDYIVFSMNDSATASISANALNKLKRHISSSGIYTKQNTFFVSKGIPKQGLGENTDDIYISCSPTSVSDEQEVVGKGLKTDSIKTENFFSEMGDFMKKTNFLNNPFTTVVISALVMVGVYKAGTAIFGFKRKVSE